MYQHLLFNSQHISTFIVKRISYHNLLIYKSSILSFIYLPILSFIYLPFHSYIYPPFIHISTILSFIYLSILSFIYLSTHPFIHISIHPFIHPFIPISIHLFIPKYPFFQYWSLFYQISYLVYSFWIQFNCSQKKF